MVVVGIDTSQRVGGVALARDGRSCAEARFGAAASHLVELGRTLDRLLSDAGLTLGDVDRVALVSGPGSFTGLRIGMAFAKGLHAGAGVELATIGSLELMALPHLEAWETVCPMLDARKREVYAAVYGRGKPDSVRAAERVAPRAMPARQFLDSLDAAPALLVGSGVERYRDDIAAGASAFADPLDQPPSASWLARIGHRLEALPAGRILSLEPDYVRSSEAELKRLRETRP